MRANEPSFRYSAVMAESLGMSVAATREDGCVASIMRNMSWGASEAQPLSAAGQMPMPQMPVVMPTEDFGGSKDLMQELHMRAAREVLFYKPRKNEESISSMRRS